MKINFFNVSFGALVGSMLSVVITIVVTATVLWFIWTSLAPTYFPSVPEVWLTVKWVDVMLMVWFVSVVKAVLFSK